LEKNIRGNNKETRAKLQCGASSHWAKQYGDGPTDEWMDGRMDGWTDGWTNGLTDRRMDGRTDRQMDRQTDIVYYRSACSRLKRNNKLYNKPGTRSPGAKQYGDGPADGPTNQPTEQRTKRVIEVQCSRLQIKKLKLQSHLKINKTKNKENKNVNVTNRCKRDDL
jgi:hypothetical protein